MIRSPLDSSSCLRWRDYKGVVFPVIRHRQRQNKTDSRVAICPPILRVGTMDWTIEQVYCDLKVERWGHQFGRQRGVFEVSLFIHHHTIPRTAINDEPRGRGASYHIIYIHVKWFAYSVSQSSTW